MNKKNNTYLILLYIAIVVLASCNKNKDDILEVKDLEANCKVTKIETSINNDVKTYNVEYNTNGKIVNASSSDGSKYTWSYTSNGYVYNRYNPNGKLKTNKIFQLNKQGQVTSFVHKVYKPNGDFSREINGTITYNNDKTLKVNFTENDSELFIYNYRWKDGNIVEFEIRDAVVKYEYYENYLAKEQLTSIDLDFISAGYSYTNGNKNLTKSSDNGSFIVDFTYEFDEKGMVRTIKTKWSNTTDTKNYSYTYLCK